MCRVVRNGHRCVILGIAHTEHRVLLVAQRQIDRLLGLVGQCLGVLLCTDIHQFENILGQSWDDLCQNLLLRVDELRLYLRTVCHRLVAYQMELVALGVVALGNVQHRAILAEHTHHAHRTFARGQTYAACHVLVH